jgi:hypothetical protein
MWSETEVWLQVVIVKSTQAISAFLISKVDPGSPQDEIFPVERKGNHYPHVDVRVSAASRMKGNRYPKAALTSGDGSNWTPVDVPPSVDLKLATIPIWEEAANGS